MAEKKRFVASKASVIASGEFTRVSVASVLNKSSHTPCARAIYCTQNLSSLTIKKPLKAAILIGGEEEIRTLEPLVTVTRFPVARPRPN